MQESIKTLTAYGWNIDTVKASCLRAARTLVHESEDGSFAVDPEFFDQFSDRAEVAAIFADSDQRSEANLLEHFFNLSVDDDQEWTSELIDENCNTASAALNEILKPELESLFPGIDWSLFMGYGEGIFGIFVSASEG